MKVLDTTAEVVGRSEVTVGRERSADCLIRVPCAGPLGIDKHDGNRSTVVGRRFMRPIDEVVCSQRNALNVVVDGIYRSSLSLSWVDSRFSRRNRFCFRRLSDVSTLWYLDVRLSELFAAFVRLFLYRLRNRGDGSPASSPTFIVPFHTRHCVHVIMSGSTQPWRLKFCSVMIIDLLASDLIAA